MATSYIKPTGKINKRQAYNEGDPSQPVVRENLLSRDGKLTKVRGTERAITDLLPDKPRWGVRYYSDEVGVTSPKTFFYTVDGKIHYWDESDTTTQVVHSGLNLNGYPNHAFFKYGNQVLLYFVDGKNIIKYDGNNSFVFTDVSITDTDGNSVEPIDVIEHRDRIFVLSKKKIFVSANLDPDNFLDPLDSLELVVGTGRGENFSFGKIEDNLFVLNSEGIYWLAGDTISAVASTFEVRLVEQRAIIATRSVARSEQALIFLAEDLELWTFDGTNTKLISYLENLSSIINPVRQFLDKAVATYEDKYYKLSFVETGKTDNNLEVWWDSIEDKIDIIRGRNVSFYLQTDQNKESKFYMTGRSDINMVMWADRGRNFDGSAIPIRLKTRDVTPEKGRNVRFEAFYPEFTPTGERNMFFRYLIDGRQSEIDSEWWVQDLSGEAKFLGVIRIANQNQTMDRVLPKINYSRGQSISFEIYDSTVDMEFELLGIGIDYTDKGRKKGKKVSQ